MVELAKVSEREVSVEELMKVDDADDGESKKKTTKKKASAKKTNKDS